MIWHALHPRAIDLLGYIPEFLSESDPRPAREQFNEAYAHGGGWRPFEGFTLHSDRTVENWSIEYPGDPEYKLVAYARLRDEMILVFPHAWVAIVASDGTYEIARMD